MRGSIPLRGTQPGNRPAFLCNKYFPPINGVYFKCYNYHEQHDFLSYIVPLSKACIRCILNSLPGKDTLFLLSVTWHQQIWPAQMRYPFLQMYSIILQSKCRLIDLFYNLYDLSTDTYRNVNKFLSIARNKKSFCSHNHQKSIKQDILWEKEKAISSGFTFVASGDQKKR